MLVPQQVVDRSFVDSSRQLLVIFQLEVVTFEAILLTRRQFSQVTRPESTTSEFLVSALLSVKVV